MFYSLLDIIGCPICKSEVSVLCPEVSTRPTQMNLWNAERKNPAGTNKPSLPKIPAQSELRNRLASYLDTSVEDKKNDHQYIDDGILVCLQCQRWFPIRDGLPELLPDHLRDWESDQNWLMTHKDRFKKAGLEEAFNFLCQYFHHKSIDANDEGSRYKIAEMGITKRNLPEGFFGPASVAPFQPLRPEFSIDHLLRFGTTVQRLEAGVNSLILDLGVGYAWTTEWLVRLGYRAVGIDICRDYLLAGLPRIGIYLPHLVVADVENLPLLDHTFDGVLSYDSFHHIPNRNQAMLELDRVMGIGTKIALVEPGKMHEKHPQSIAVMQQHGILEIGFDQEDLENYVRHTALQKIVHHRTDAHPHDIFTVQKDGIFVPTSLSPRNLFASIELDPILGSTETNTPVNLTLSITNLGDTTWLSTGLENRGAVRVGAHLYDANRTLIQPDYLEIILPQSVNPGENIRVACSIPPIREPGEYILEFDLLIVGLLWFKDYAFNVKDWRYSIRENSESSQINKSNHDLVSPILIQPDAWTLTKFTQPSPSQENEKHSLAGAAVDALLSGGPFKLIRKTISYIFRKIRSKVIE